MPTLLLLNRLFAYLASEPGTSTGPPSSGDNDAGLRSDGSVSSASVRETHIHLQDYNRSVLELVTFPNVLLAWCPSLYYITSRHSCLLKNLPTDMSPLSAVHRASATDSDSDLDSNVDENEEGKEATRGRRAAHGHKPGGLTVTQGLLDAFTASLDAYKVRLCFFAGSWASLSEKLAHQGKPYDIVLASETIYRPPVPRCVSRCAMHSYRYTYDCCCVRRGGAVSAVPCRGQGALLWRWRRCARVRTCGRGRERYATHGVGEIVRV